MMHVTMLPLLQQQEICLKSALTAVSEGHIAFKDCLILRHTKRILRLIRDTVET